MVVAIKTYHSAEEIAEKIDKEIAETKSSLGEYLRRLDEIRSLAEKSKKIRDAVMRISGKKNGASESSGDIEVGSLTIVLDPNALQELAAIESVVRSHQERLMVLQKAREGLRPLDQLGDTDGLTFMIVEDQGIPERILLKAS